MGFGSNGEEAVPSLIIALKDNDKLIRSGAAQALYSMGKVATPASTVALNDRNCAVHDEASKALKK